ncbi:hypothetical protein [Alcanivorax sp.]|uniref:hypothetical protein n=1 Tax=Alcanivorax sp. TaxID=1872427 RepID=UPI002B269C81|nr:hypothetical protein [Alcanivorax sp.]
MNVLYAPVGITPTKPLTASHLRGVLLVDAMRKLRAMVDRVTVWHNRRPWDLSMQTTRFWGYLDETFPQHDYSWESDISLGMKYVQAHQTPIALSANVLKAYAGKVDQEGYLHPSAQRLLSLWCNAFASVCVDPEILTCSERLQLDASEVIERLAGLDVLLDQRRQGGGCYIDLTDDGVPLRKIVDADGSENYLVAILRDLWARASLYDKTFLVYDSSVERDYIILQKVLERSGILCQRCAFKRVPVDGQVASSRMGGWKGATVSELLALLSPFSAAATSLGVRMYFLYHLGMRNPASYDPDELVRQVELSERLLVTLPDRAESMQSEVFWRQFITRSDDVDVYRALSLISAKKTTPAQKAALVECLL